MNQLSVLNPENPLFKAISEEFQMYICDSKKQFVWCCHDAETAIESKVEILQEPSGGKDCDGSR